MYVLETIFPLVCSVADQQDVRRVRYIQPRHYRQVLTADEVYKRIEEGLKEKREKQAKKGTQAKKGNHRREKDVEEGSDNGMCTVPSYTYTIHTTACS